LKAKKETRSQLEDKEPKLLEKAYQVLSAKGNDEDKWDEM
jgi:hypothetical protein